GNCTSGNTGPLSHKAERLYPAPFITPHALITARLLAWRPRWTTARRCAAANAVLPGLMAGGGQVLLLTFAG
ncbi:hypothetical protein, partial [Streptomyces sp. JV190]|uniref:hypothetical protein n=1 Tax=Streptomyces sp. JV190 TaxID=3002533 RepID=UPI002E77547D